MPVTKVRVTDFMEDAFLDTELANLSSAFASLETVESEGTRQLWSVLGGVFELGAKVEQNGAARLALIERVSRDPNVQDSPKWNPSKRTAHELLLVTLLSIKRETKAKKSQWLSAIRAAEIAQTGPAQADFVAFLEGVGGIDGARKLHAKQRNPKLTYEELVQKAYGFMPPDPSDFDKITIPKFLDETPDLPGRIGLVIVHGKRAGDKAIRIATIADEKLIGRCIEFLLKEEKIRQAEFDREIAKESKAAIAEMKKAKKKLRAQYSRDKKAFRGPHHYPTFAEYVDEKFAEDESLSRLKAEYQGEYETFLQSLA